MAQQFDYPKSESELRQIQDLLYAKTKEELERGDAPRFKGLIEIASSEVIILTAIHNIKANKGSETAGSDGEKMREDILQKDYPSIITRVKECFKHYKPNPVRRVYIEKPGKQEKRPLGIPAIIDRIIQECIKIVIEPILEAQFFKHSYGFRPMRDAQMALERICDMVHHTGYYWIIEGDISKFFDHVNHTKLCKKLWHMGIRDRRMLMIIKAMLKAGIMNEIKENPLGTAQGGNLSPLLANAYLDDLDTFISREWEEKKTKVSYKRSDSKILALRKRSNLKPAYLIRYADDWALVTNSKGMAEKWKKRISSYLASKLKLTLSEEKTLITDVREKPIHFVGFNFKVRRGKSRKGWIVNTKPNPERLKAKVSEIRGNIKRLRRINYKNKYELVHEMNKINSQIRGIIQYYETATRVSVSLAKCAYTIRYTAYKALKKFGGKWVSAKEVNNLISVHTKYTSQIPTIEYAGMKLGLTDLRFCKWKRTLPKIQSETPYTIEGRDTYRERTGKRPLLVRADELLDLHLSQAIKLGLVKKLYNFEYLLNRAYAFNRDKGNCRICREPVDSDSVQIHHDKPWLPMCKVNKVINLSTVHVTCHQMIHDEKDYSFLKKQVWSKILHFREKLIPSN